MTKTAILLLVLTAAAPAFAGRPFELYQPIIDRCPFGPPPDDATLPPEIAKRGAGGDAADGEDEVELSEQQAELQQTTTVSIINIETGGRVMVGFTDVGTTPPKHYYMEEGESRDGWLVKSADPVKKEVTLVKNDVEVVRKLGEKAAAAQKGGNGGGRRGGWMRGAGGGRSQLLGGRNRAAAGGENQPMDTMKSRRQQKREQEEQERRARIEQAEAAKKLQEESERQREQAKAEMEAEREEMRRNLENLRDEIRRQNEERRQRESEQPGDVQQREEGANE